MSARLWICCLALASLACPKEADGPDPKAQADGLYLAGTAAYLQGNFTEAHEHFAKVKALNPTDPRLAGAEGEVYLAEGKINEALKAYEEAVKVDGKRPTTWSRIGTIQAMKGEREAAKKSLGKALELNPRDYNALEALGDLALRDKQLDEAVKNFLMASEAAPDMSKAELVLRATGELVKGGKKEEALKVLEAVVAKGVKSPALMSELGDRLVEAVRLPDAVAAYTEAAKADKTDPTLWELVGELQMKLDKPGDAEASFRESLRVKDRAVVHVALARMCQAKKDQPCVASELDKALATASGEEVRETLELCELLSSVGRPKDALALLRSLFEDPEHQKDVQLQLKAVKYAKDAKDAEAVKVHCAAAKVADPALKKCP